ncbi:hypothetical protein BGZ94_005424 [Podila epigama]|nr:hypothetical protein BGZ94_005424 [Podila epigama]
MSCDLSDPAILDAYHDIVNGGSTNWLVLGYRDTRDKIFLYSKGSKGVDEMRANMNDDILFGFVRIEDSYALLAYVSEHVSGLRRARALVHGKVVGTLFKNNHVQINSPSLADFTEPKIRARMGLVEGPPTPDPSNSPILMPSSPVSVAPVVRPATPISPPPSKDDTTSYIEAVSPARTETARQSQDTASERHRATEEREALDHKNRASMATQRQILERELEIQRKAESEQAAREAMKKQLIEYERLRGEGLSGYISVQRHGSPFWQRQFYIMRGQVMALYRDEEDEGYHRQRQRQRHLRCGSNDDERGPLFEMKFGGRVMRIADASEDVLIRNCFRVEMYNGDTHFFFSDTSKDMELAIAGIMKCNESA